MASPSRRTDLAVALPPITALDATRFDGQDLLLVGKGSVLEVFNVTNLQQLCRSSVLERQAIHGITVLGRQQKLGSCEISLLAYGGRQVTWVLLNLTYDSRNALLADLALVHTCWLRDWILCAKSCTSRDFSAVLLTSYNALCSITADQSARRLEWSLLCHSLSVFLYSADFLPTDDNSFVVASGTAFGELLIWLCRRDQHDKRWRAYPWREYLGHSGSIFGVSISPAISFGDVDRRIVATSSDDRTIRVWDASGIEEGAIAVNQRDAEVAEDKARLFPRCDKDLTMTWAHFSRIWSVDFGATAQSTEGVPYMHLLSTGEDGQAQSWLLDVGKLFSLERSVSSTLTMSYTDHQHAGKNVWARCQLRNEHHVQFATGGADGQVVRRSYDNNGHADARAIRLIQLFKAICPSVHDSMPSEIVPAQRRVVLKSYLVTGAYQVLATTDTGLLLRGERAGETVSWQVLAYSRDSQPFVLSSSLAQHYAFFIDRSRSMLCAVDVNTSMIRDICQMRRIRVATVQVACSGNKSIPQSSSACVAVNYFGNEDLELIWVTIDAQGSRSSSTLVTLPETFELTSAYVDTGTEVLLLGSRAGAVALYTGINDCTSVTHPTTCRRRIHGEETITSITVLKGGMEAAGDELFYLTTGRDGTYSVLRLDLGLSENEKDQRPMARLHVVHRGTPQMGPYIEGAQLVKQPGHTQTLLLYGFRSKNFVVWDETNQTQVMAVDCGGAHRSWNLRLNDSTGEAGTFVWTKAGAFMCYSQAQADHKIILSGGHGREIKALAVHYHRDDSSWLIATGSEDTDIRLFKYTTDNDGNTHLQNIAVVRKHTTGLQDLQFSPDGSILFSAAGMEELFAWRLSTVPVLGQGVVFAGALPRTDTQSDARIMSFDVKTSSDSPRGPKNFSIVAAFSNGKAKTIEYSMGNQAEDGIFTELGQLDLGTICLTQVRTISSSTTNRIQAITGATNGLLTSLGPLRTAAYMAEPTMVSHKVHQNSITAMHVESLPMNHELILTGGDDNSLALTLAHYPSRENHKPTFRTLTIPNAHAAALTALAVVEDRCHNSGYKSFTVTSAGNDQILRIWRVKIMEGLFSRVDQSYENCTSEPAASALGVMREGTGQDFDEVQVEFVKEQYTNVADISGLEVLNGDQMESFLANEHTQSLLLVVVGVGVEVLEIEL